MKAKITDQYENESAIIKQIIVDVPFKENTVLLATQFEEKAGFFGEMFGDKDQIVTVIRSTNPKLPELHREVGTIEDALKTLGYEIIK